MKIKILNYSKEKKMIYVYVGVMGSGKDFRAVEQMKTSPSEKKIKIGFADAVREFAWKILGWEPITDSEYIDFKNDSEITLKIHDREITSLTGRLFLQRIGTDAVRSRYPKFWIDIAKQRIEELSKEGYDIFITDCRFDNELDMLKEFDDVKIMFCDYKSEYYGWCCEHESEEMAHRFIKEGFVDGQMIYEK